MDGFSESGEQSSNWQGLSVVHRLGFVKQVTEIIEVFKDIL